LIIFNDNCTVRSISNLCFFQRYFHKIFWIHINPLKRQKISAYSVVEGQELALHSVYFNINRFDFLPRDANLIITVIVLFLQRDENYSTFRLATGTLL
jgi:hypothetical protein